MADQRQLLAAVFNDIDLRPECSGVRPGLAVPDQMFARNANAGNFAIQSIQAVQVFRDPLANDGGFRGGQALACR